MKRRNFLKCVAQSAGAALASLRSRQGMAAVAETRGGQPLGDRYSAGEPSTAPAGITRLYIGILLSISFQTFPHVLRRRRTLPATLHRTLGDYLGRKEDSAPLENGLLSPSVTGTPQGGPLFAPAK